jgi:hypothetical protein
MTRDANTGLGIDFTFYDHVGHINNRGNTVIHEVGLRCPCDIEDTHAGQVEHGQVLRQRRVISCDLCGGSGLIFRNARRIVGLVIEITEGFDQKEEGWAEPGDCILSVKPGTVISGGDRITATWEQPINKGQVIVRGAANTSENQARKLNIEEDEDRLHYHAASGIWCEGIDGTRYREGSDFVLDGSRLIKWIGNSPAVRTSYTVKYNAFLEWIAWTPPNVRIDRDRDLGTRVPLKKSHAVLVNEDPRASTQDRVPFCDRLRGCS